MPFLDLSDLILDPDFAGAMSQITVTRQAETVGSNGRASFTTSSFTPLAVVAPAAGLKLDILPEAARTEGSISVITSFHLLQASASNAADQLTWRGVVYTVAHVSDWTQYGAGFIEAICTIRDLQGTAS